MFDAAGLVSISLGSVVLDSPDQTGRFIAKDLAGGWAYLVGDADGDNRCRGQGVCDGGLDLTLRCAFLSAASRVPDCSLIRIVVDTRQAHRMMVLLAVNDPHVVAAIAGRPISILTRPEARSSLQVRTAAERAASAALRSREHTERHASAADTARLAASTAETVAAATEARAEAVPTRTLDTIPDWRLRLRHGSGSASTVASLVSAPARKAVPAASTPSAMIRRLVSPILSSARNSLYAGARPAPRNQAVKAWLQDLENHVATISGDLQDVGA
jgi:hypothetical protein